MSADPIREVIAVRYGTGTTTRSKTFAEYEQYGEPDASMPIDFYFWVIRDADGVGLVDTGFERTVGAKHGRRIVVEPLAALTALGIDPSDVGYIVVTHLHYDHVGHLAEFPNATVFVQGAELDYWTAADESAQRQEHLIERDDLEWLIGAWERGLVEVVEGDVEIRPGIRLMLTGGHTRGQQMVRVESGSGPVLLASDAVHFSEELETGRPYFVCDDAAEMRTTYRRLRDAMDEGVVVVSGHDPDVMARFPSVDGVAEGLAVRVG